mgnify:CR=1 FL=1
MNMKRHTLVEISVPGRERIFRELNETYDLVYYQEFKKLILEGYGSVFIPGIIRRPEKIMPDGVIPVGFASLNRIDGNRMRVPSFLYSNEVTAFTTPYETVKMDFIPRNNCLNMLMLILNCAKNKEIETGVWGSAGLELYTGLPFTDDNSDIDILVKPAPYQKLKSFFDEINELGSSFSSKADVELDLPDLGGVKLAELFMNTDTLLCKSINDVKLIRKEDVIEAISFE